MSYRSVYKGSKSTRWRQIADHYRKLIASGKLAAGSRLPSTQALAKEYDVSVYCVQYALAALTHEGLVSRRPRYGTIVNEYTPGLKVAGILLLVYDDRSFNSFRSSLMAELSRQLNKKGCEVVTIIEDAREPNLVERIRGTIRKLGIQAIIPFSCAKEDMSIFQKINIPIVHEAKLSGLNKGVEVLREEFPVFAIDALAKKGCRKPALITGFTDVGLDMNDPYERPKRLFFENYKNEVEKHGMTYHEDLICKAREIEPMVGKELVEHGYRSFMKLWETGKRPDAIITFTDELLPGVILAIKEKGLKVPDDLIVASHHNSTSEIFVPFDFIKIELDIKEFAAAKIEQLFSEFKREPGHETTLHFKVK